MPLTLQACSFVAADEQTTLRRPLGWVDLGAGVGDQAGAGDQNFIKSNKPRVVRFWPQSRCWRWSALLSPVLSDVFTKVRNSCAVCFVRARPYRRRCLVSPLIPPPGRRLRMMEPSYTGGGAPAAAAGAVFGRLLAVGIRPLQRQRRRRRGGRHHARRHRPRRRAEAAGGGGGGRHTLLAGTPTWRGGCRARNSEAGASPLLLCRGSALACVCATAANSGPAGKFVQRPCCSTAPTHPFGCLRRLNLAALCCVPLRQSARIRQRPMLT